MENFKELTLRDKDLFNNYLKDFNNKSYEYSFTSLYLWRDLCKTKYSIINNCLIIKKETNYGSFFMMPIGYNKATLQELILKLEKLPTNDSIYLLGDIEDNLPGWNVVIGPEESMELPKFLKGYQEKACQTN